MPFGKVLCFMCWLNVILNFNQGLVIFRQEQILRSNRHKNLQNQNNDDFFIQLYNSWLHFTNNNFPTPNSEKEIFDQSIFLKPYIKLDFSTDNAYFCRIPPMNISEKFTMSRDPLRIYRTRSNLLYMIWWETRFSYCQPLNKL